jgi:hypothetical protein
MTRLRGNEFVAKAERAMIPRRWSGGLRTSSNHRQHVAG